MDRETVRLTSAEVIHNIASILDRVGRGTEVIVDGEKGPVAVIRPAAPPIRLLSECIALAEAHGSKITLDEGFSRDLEEVIASREPLDASAWD